MLSRDKYQAMLFAERAAKAQNDFPVAPAITEALERYTLDRIPTGGFLAACLANDLHDACARADDVNRFNLYNIVGWIQNVVPIRAWGSREAVKRWLSTPETTND